MRWLHARRVDPVKICQTLLLVVLGAVVIHGCGPEPVSGSATSFASDQAAWEDLKADTVSVCSTETHQILQVKEPPMAENGWRIWYGLDRQGARIMSRVTEDAYVVFDEQGGQMYQARLGETVCLPRRARYVVMVNGTFAEVQLGDEPVHLSTGRLEVLSDFRSRVRIVPASALRINELTIASADIPTEDFSLAVLPGQYVVKAIEGATIKRFYVPVDSGQAGGVSRQVSLTSDTGSLRLHVPEGVPPYCHRAAVDYPDYQLVRISKDGQVFETYHIYPEELLLEPGTVEISVNKTSMTVEVEPHCTAEIYQGFLMVEEVEGATWSVSRIGADDEQPLFADLPTGCGLRLLPGGYTVTIQHPDGQAENHMVTLANEP